MLADKDYADPEHIQEGKSEIVKAKITAVDVAGIEHTKTVTIPYDADQVQSHDVLQDLDKEVEKTFGAGDITYYFDEKLFTDKIVSFKVARERTKDERETSIKLFTKSRYEDLQEAKYEEPTDRAKQIIDEAEEDDRLQLKVRIKGKPKVLEASRIQDQEDLVIAMSAKRPFDSEELEDE